MEEYSVFVRNMPQAIMLPLGGNKEYIECRKPYTRNQIYTAWCMFKHGTPTNREYDCLALHDPNKITKDYVRVIPKALNPAY